MYNRIVSAFVLIPIVIFMIFFSSLVQFTMFALVICLISAWEWGKLMQLPIGIYCIWMYVMLSLLCGLVIIIDKNYLCFDNNYIFFSICSAIIGWWVLAFLLVLFYPRSAILWNTSNTLRFCFGTLMILPFFFGLLILYQFHYCISGIHGKWWLFYILVLIWVNDSAAYVIGKKFGKYKLLYNVSPKKTWEGCIGGIVISTALAWIFSKYIAANMNNFYIVFISFVGSILFSVIGDLTESMFKRDADVKDISNLIPGHGGLLDRIDSLMSSIPIFVMLILLLIRINNIF